MRPSSLFNLPTKHTPRCHWRLENRGLLASRRSPAASSASSGDAAEHCFDLRGRRRLRRRRLLRRQDHPDAEHRPPRRARPAVHVGLLHVRDLHAEPLQPADRRVRVAHAGNGHRPAERRGSDQARNDDAASRCSKPAGTAPASSGSGTWGWASRRSPTGRARSSRGRSRSASARASSSPPPTTACRASTSAATA